MSIGDINSPEKGSGARFNDGKPDLALLPLRLLGNAYLRADDVRWRRDNLALPGVPETASPYVMVLEGPAVALQHLGAFQHWPSSSPLYDALTALDDNTGWADCARVFEYGRKKYAAWNWAKGMPWSVPLACAARHLVALLDHEDKDPESGLPHRGHVYCNVVMLLQYLKTYQEGNDLPPKGLLL